MIQLSENYERRYESEQIILLLKLLVMREQHFDTLVNLITGDDNFISDDCDFDVVIAWRDVSVTYVFDKVNDKPNRIEFWFGRLYGVRIKTSLHTEDVILRNQHFNEVLDRIKQFVTLKEETL